MKINVCCKLLSIFSLLLLLNYVDAQELRRLQNNAFQVGEMIKYKVYYDSYITGKVKAGEAVLEIEEGEKINGNRRTFHIKGKGYSAGLFSRFFKVEDFYETIMDQHSIMPWKFIRRVNEGGYKISQDVVFDQLGNKAKTNNNTPITIPSYTQDIISAFYYARTLNFDKLKKGDAFPIRFFMDDSVFVTKVVYLGKDTIKTGMGKIACLKFKPKMLTGNVFSEPYPMMMWITDDKNHIPIMVKSKILVGTVKLELIKYSGLKNDFAAKLK